jgi:hypothetical protein
MSIYTPTELYTHVEEERDLRGGEAFVTNRNCNRLREMWCASLFGQGFEQHIAPCEIEIAETDEQRDFDFQLHAHGDIHPFQVTEVLDEGRRRNQEYRNGFSGCATEDGVVVDIYAHERLSSAIQVKIDKNYADSKKLHLLLYANFVGNDASWATMVSNLSGQCTHFASVWIITGNEICCISSGVKLYGFSQWKKING